MDDDSRSGPALPAPRRGAGTGRAETSAHPDQEHLLDLARGLLRGARGERVERHARSCGRCGRQLLGFRSASAVAGAAVAPPAHTTRALLRLFPAPVAAPLVFDSATAPQPLGVRSRDERRRQLVFDDGDYAIDLEIGWLDPDRVSVVGQVMSHASGRGMATVRVLNGAFEVAETNQLGEFLAELRPPSRLSFALDRRRVDIELPAR